MATATCPRVCSPAEAPLFVRCGRWLRTLFALAVALLAAWPAAARQLTFSIDGVDHPAFSLRDVRIVLNAGAGSADLRIGRLNAVGFSVRDLGLHCAVFRFSASALICEGGRLDLPGLPGGVAAVLQVDPSRRSGTLRLQFSPDETLVLAVGQSGAVKARFQALDLARLATVLPVLARWQPQGRLSGSAGYTPVDGGELKLAVTLDQGAFSSADGLQAGQGLAFSLDTRARRVGGGWRWQASAAWKAGEAYLHALYLTAGPRLQAAGSYADGRVEVHSAALALDGVRSLAANAVVDLRTGRLDDAGLAIAEADLAVIGPIFIAPLVAPAQADRLKFAGHASVGLRIIDGNLVALDAALDQAGFSLDGTDLSFGPVSGVVPWRSDTATEAVLKVKGGRWQALQLGEFELMARLHGRQWEVPRLRIPMLDGALVFERLALQHGDAGWSGQGGVVVEPVSMPMLTRALGWPEMAGVLSAALPGLRVSPGEVVLDGTLVVSVFDGYLQVSQLRLLEPFGVAAHLYADIDARHIDLAQLTHTFSFGSISGYVDANVSGLELAGWRPVRFDARVVSSPGSYPRRISQRAVQNIGALGGAGAVAAIQRSVLRFFDSFGYREIGLSCVLANGVCQMGGLGDVAGGGYQLVRGGGIPALNVIGYNRQVDWQELIDRLQGAIASNAAPIIR
ncbi:hypothetical protein [Pseudothauera hydrothermalis]|uniref:hypothetical protein n=1 Tax=Pseudothauera hydrothermalis TaxID=2184083 RepID=UPI0013C35094|nr:hypothetical protein [Pseudothauera hydrothermalis]